MLKNDRLITVVILLLVSSTLPSLCFGQSSDLRPVTSTYAIRNATIIQAPGQSIENGTIVFKDGVIKSVGSNVSIPADAWVIDADSMYIYAGFITGLSTIGVDKPKEKDGKDDRKLTGNPSYERAGISPQANVREMLNPKEKSISTFRKLGFTASHSVPHNGMLPGKGAIILLGGSSKEDMLLRDNTSLFSQWQGANGVYPNTIIGIMAKYRDLYRKASQARDYNSRYQSNNNGMERPTSDIVLEAFYPVIGKQIPVAFKAESFLDIHRAITLKNELGFNMILNEVKQGWDAIPSIKSSGLPVFLSMDLPEMVKEKEKKEDEEDEGDVDETNEPSQEEKEKASLELRKKEIIAKHYNQPKEFSSQNIKFGFSLLEGKAKDFKTNLLNIIEAGLSEDQALAALTTTPADILGLSSSMGTLENGKIANLIVTDKPYFSKESNVKYVFVDGIKYEYASKLKKKKSSGEDPVELSGKWNYTTETPQGSGNGVISLNGADSDYSGTITMSFNDSTNEIRDVVVDGNNLSFSFTLSLGQDLNVDISMEIDGEDFEGSLSVTGVGTFPMQGSKAPQN